MKGPRKALHSPLRDYKNFAEGSCLLSLVQSAGDILGKFDALEARNSAEWEQHLQGVSINCQQ